MESNDVHVDTLKGNLIPRNVSSERSEADWERRVMNLKENSDEGLLRSARMMCLWILNVRHVFGPSQSK